MYLSMYHLLRHGDGYDDDGGGDGGSDRALLLFT